MNSTSIYLGAGLIGTVLGIVIAVGAFLTTLGIPTGIDGDSVLVGASIAVAGTGAAYKLFSSESVRGEESDRQ